MIHRMDLSSVKSFIFFISMTLYNYNWVKLGNVYVLKFSWNHKFSKFIIAAPSVRLPKERCVRWNAHTDLQIHTLTHTRISAYGADIYVNLIVCIQFFSLLPYLYTYLSMYLPSYLRIIISLRVFFSFYSSPHDIISFCLSAKIVKVLTKGLS